MADTSTGVKRIEAIDGVPISNHEAEVMAKVIKVGRVKGGAVKVGAVEVVAPGFVD